MSMRKGTRVVARKDIRDDNPDIWIPHGAKGQVVDVIRHPTYVEYDVKFDEFPAIWMCTKEDIQRA